MVIQFLQAIFFPAFLQQLDRRAEGDEITQFAHIDAIAIRVADLGGGRDNDYLFRMQPGQHPDNAFLQGGSSYDGVIDDDQGIDILLHGPIGHVVDMLHHFVSAGIFRYERTHLYVLDGHFFHSDLAAEHFHQFVLRDIVPPGEDTLDLDTFQVIVHAFPEAIESHFGGIGNKGEDGIFQVVVDRTEYRVAEVIPEGNAFAVDLFIAAAGEINAFETAGPAFLWLQDGLYRDGP